MGGVLDDRLANELGVHECDRRQFDELRANYPDAEPRMLAATLARRRAAKRPVTRELLVFEVATLNQWGFPLILWQCLPLDEEVVWSQSGAVRYPACLEIRLDYSAFDWGDEDDFRTMLVRATDPDFDPARGYPDEDGAQSLGLLREAVLGRSVRITTSEAVIVSVEPSPRPRVSGDELEEIRSRTYEDTRAISWDPNRLRLLKNQGVLE